MADEIHIRPWLVEMVIAPKSTADREKLVLALAKLAAEDVFFHAAADPEAGQMILKGLDERQLDAKIGILRSGHKIDVAVSPPRAAYRETITRQADVDYTHKKLAGAAGEFARVILEIEPNEKGKGCAIESKLVDGTVPDKFLPAVEKGITSVLSSGVVAGFPVLDVKVVLIGGAYHQDSSSAAAFEIASRAALREGLWKAGPVMLEPVMKVEITTPADHLGGVITDLKSRRGQISDADTQLVTAIVPLANMFGYSDSLRAISRARATYVMQFDHYAPVPLPDDDPSPFPPAIGMRA